MNTRVDIISIGTLAKNLIWSEQQPIRTQHATCALIRTGKRVILVDPGLPSVILSARLQERAGLSVADVTDVFLTHISPSTTRGLDAFDKADVFASELELESAPPASEDGPDLSAVKAAPDKLAPGVDLFPLYGFTPGTSGLLVIAAVHSTLITGPAVASLDHFLAGQILPEAMDYKTAREALAEVYEIADIIVPGFDNTFINPRQFGG